jgi:hypothetical protein
LPVAQKLTAEDLIRVIERLVAKRGSSAHVLSGNGGKFIARILVEDYRRDYNMSVPTKASDIAPRP